MGEVALLKAVIADKDREIGSLMTLLDSQEKSRIEFQQKYQNALNLFERRHNTDHEKYCAADNANKKLQQAVDKFNIEKDQLNKEICQLKAEIDNYKSRDEIQSAAKVLESTKIYEKLNLDNLEAREDMKKAMQVVQDDFALQI